MRAHRVPVLAVIVAAGLALAGCGRSAPSPGASSTAGGTTSSPSVVAYSACMRSHGVSKFPDPDSSGHVPKADAQQLGVSSAQLLTAQQACQSTLPAGGSNEQQEEECYQAGECPQALVQQILSVQRQYAGCMRAHGVPNFPDPVIDSEGRPYFDASKAGLTSQFTHSSAFEAKDRVCERLVSGTAGGVPVPFG
jgi:hypothetical protein